MKEESKKISQRLRLNDLTRLLDVQDLKFMVKRVFRYGDTVYAHILPYKNSRVDMSILDEVVGIGMWQNEYKRDSQGVLQCGIGIYIEELKEWVWKWSNGTPSQFEKQKGEYSDAFKRAGYLWGIGRALYDFPRVHIQLQDREFSIEPDNKVKATGFLKPDNWDWDIWIDDDNGLYEQVVVSDKNGNVLFNLEPHKERYKNPDNKKNK